MNFVPGMIVPMEGTGGPVTFHWNPMQIDGESADAGWAAVAVAGRELPHYHYTNGNDSVVSFEMDVSHGQGSVKGIIDQLIALTKPTAGGNVKRPPKVKLILGTRKWTGVIRNIQPQTMGPANPSSLDPYQGKVKVTLIRMLEE